MTTSLSENSTIKTAKAWLRERLGKGADCPVCNQRVQMYKRKITASMCTTAARVLAAQTRGKTVQKVLPKVEGDYVYLPSIPQRSRDFSTLQFFDLAEQKPGKRPDGGAAGWWRITEKGKSFLHGDVTVRKYVQVFDGKRYGWEGDDVTIDDIAPEFRLDELLAGA